MLLRQIEYFQAVVEQNSFTAAAEQCNISQSAISQQIQALEELMGVKLLNRTKVVTNKDLSCTLVFANIFEDQL